MEASVAVLVICVMGAGVERCSRLRQILCDIGPLNGHGNAGQAAVEGQAQLLLAVACHTGLPRAKVRGQDDGVASLIAECCLDLLHDLFGRLSGIGASRMGRPTTR